jgi:alkyl sulfatase BDS1-like metallo-beta-lactamase superfamily hydrolase
LPATLAANPYLQEFYGTVEWSVRAIYTYYLGWFDGNATGLFPLAGRERAARIVAMAGGEAVILGQVRDALAKQEFQWAAELTDFLLAGQPSHIEARGLKAQALTELGERQVSANARNFYLSSAQSLLGEPAVR